MSILSADNPAFRIFVVSSAAVGLKMAAMAFATAYCRFANKAFANEEDGKMIKVAPKPDAAVERVRRAHLNDLENIPMFWALGSMFLFTEPSLLAAQLCFYGFAAARCVHTAVYLLGLQPHRALAFFYGQGVNMYMAVNILLAFWN